MPFSGNSYDEIVHKNTQGKIDFNLAKFGIQVSDES